jgi:predicted transglutaminase-like cysteine proteinase
MLSQGGKSMRIHVSSLRATALVALCAMWAAAPAAAQRSGLAGNGGSAVSAGAGRIGAFPRSGLSLATGFIMHSDLPAPVEPSLFGTVAVPAGTTPVSARWTRVSTVGIYHPVLANIADRATSMDRRRQAAFVQMAINRAITYRHDHSHWNANDYWATAEETLRRGAGDCEDIAVAKMQALRRLGFAPRDLYLTVGRIADGGEHATLLVRIDNRFWVLDDRDDRMVEAGAFGAFDPMTTFGAGMTWIHGRRVAPRPAQAVARVTTASVGSAAR